jgi:Sec-independent protein secretion pathway component TatC
MVVITKNFYITLALAACVIFAGGILFRHSQIGVFATLILAFGGGLSLLQFLDDRERRRKREAGDDSLDR